MVVPYELTDQSVNFGKERRWRIFKLAQVVLPIAN